MTISIHRPLPAEIRAIQDDLEAKAREYGLDFFDTIFEVVDYEEMSMFAAFGGFPTRYPHWRFGAEYDELMKGYSYGLQKIYEMVINTDPCYAYLLEANALIDQKLVIAHVYGHCDFFKNNAWFAKTNRRMLDQMANHATRVNRYVDRFGYEAVEEFIDACLSIDDLIDPYSPHIQRSEKPSARQKPSLSGNGEDEARDGATRFPSKGYMDPFINPPDVLRKEQHDQIEKQLRKEESRSFPEEPQRDVLLFLLEHAPLKDWQHDVLSIVRDESYYFAPQGQTKIANEGWACMTGGSLVVTDRGLRPIEQIVADAEPCRVADGESVRPVLDRVRFEDRETVTIRTRRGLVLGGSTTHRMWLEDGSWKRLDELSVGDRLRLGRGTDLWSEEYVELSWQPPQRLTLSDIAEQVGVSYDTVWRHYRKGLRGGHAADIEEGLRGYEAQSATMTAVLPATRHPIRVPRVVDEDLAALMGYLIGDGHISDIKRTIGLTTGDREQADRFAELVQDLFGLTPRIKRDGGRWRVCFTSRSVRDFLVSLGLKTGRAAREKTVPDCILRSPASVVAGFLRALFDCDGYAGKAGVILSTTSDKLGEVVQLLLLNFGILSRRRQQTSDGCWHIAITGTSARLFFERVGFGLGRKQEALKEYIENRRWFEREQEADEVVHIERGRGDVYDLTVAETHRYVAQGLINHNSYWHSTIMTQYALTDAEIVDFADHHSGTMATSPHRLNPYKLGIELLRDIEERWNKGQFGPEWEECDDIVEKMSWDKQLGLGREKIFEVRRVHNDVTFIDTFLTPEFCAKHKMFSFAYNDATNYYEIASREFPKIKWQLLNGLTNHGRPFIYVVDGNYRNRGELYLQHRYMGTELKLDYARDTLQHLGKLWGRPVHLETVVDDEETIFSYDGHSHEMRMK